MFKTAALISTAALTLAAISSPALAQSFSPVNSTTTLSGNLELEQTQIIDCDVSVDVSIDGAGAATVTNRSFTPGSFFCGLLVQPTGTWTVTAGPGASSVTLSIGASTVTGGSCFGTVTVPYNSTTGELYFNNVSVPGTPNACRILGSLYASPVITIVP